MCAGPVIVESRFGWVIECWVDTLILRKGDDVVRQAKAQFTDHFTPPRVHNFEQCDVIVFSEHVIILSTKGLRRFGGDFPIHAVSDLTDRILVVEELRLSVIALDGAVLVEASPSDIPHEFSVSGDRLDYVDWERKLTRYSLPDLKVMPADLTSKS